MSIYEMGQSIIGYMELPVVAARVDLSRVAREWYEIGRSPCAQQRVGTYGKTTYVLLEPSRLRMVCETYDKLTDNLLEGRVTGDAVCVGNGRLRVRLGWFGRLRAAADHDIYYMNASYTTMVVGSLKMVWIMVGDRSKVHAVEIAFVKGRLAEMGFDVDNLYWTI